MSSIDGVIDQLFTDGVLDIDDLAEISTSTIPSERNRMLIHKIRTKDQFEKFVEALKQDSVNNELAREIEQTHVTEEELSTIKSHKGEWIYYKLLLFL